MARGEVRDLVERLFYNASWDGARLLRPSGKVAAIRFEDGSVGGVGVLDPTLVDEAAWKLIARLQRDCWRGDGWLAFRDAVYDIAVAIGRESTREQSMLTGDGLEWLVRDCPEESRPTVICLAALAAKGQNVAPFVLRLLP
jgi:hypothetical protein